MHFNTLHSPAQAEGPSSVAAQLHLAAGGLKRLDTTQLRQLHRGRVGSGKVSGVGWGKVGSVGCRWGGVGLGTVG